MLPGAKARVSRHARILIGAAIVPAAWVVALTFVAAGFTLEDAGPLSAGPPPHDGPDEPIG